MKTKEKILQGAKAYLLKYGQGGFTVRSIAKEAGVNPGLVHHYFGSKENLILDLVETESNTVLRHIRDSIGPTLSESDVDTIQASIIENFLTNTVAMKLFIETIILADSSPVLKNRMRELAISRREIVAGLLGINDPIAEIIFQSGVLGVMLLKKLDASVDLKVILKRLYEITKNMPKSEEIE